jgi:transposase
MFSSQKIKQINDLYKKGLPIRDIAKIIPCTQATVYRHLDEKTKRRGEHCLRIDRKKLKNLPKDYHSGKYSMKKLMEKYQIGSEETLYRLLDEMNVERIRTKKN